MRLTLKEQSECGMFCPGWQNGMGCYVQGDKNSMGCYVRGDKNSIGCFVRGGKSLWDVLSRVSNNGMGCFVPGCFVRLPMLGSRGEMQDSGRPLNKIRKKGFHSSQAIAFNVEPSSAR